MAAGIIGAFMPVLVEVVKASAEAEKEERAAEAFQKDKNVDWEGVSLSSGEKKVIEKAIESGDPLDNEEVKQILTQHPDQKAAITSAIEDALRRK